MGNRLSRVRTGTSPTEDTYYYYPDTNRLKAVVGDHAELIQYDADGNTIQRIPGTSNPQPPIGDPADYIYNNAGQRIIKETTTDVIYHYDLSGQLIAETDGSGNMIKAYVWLSGQPLAMIASDGSIYYFHNDHLGTPQKLTDSTGALVWSADYLPFGRADVNIATVENNLRFAGQYYDQDTGLHYNWNRYYDPSIGRYLRADPIGIDGGVNLYIYSQNNPANATDRLGLYTGISPVWGPPGLGPNPAAGNSKIDLGVDFKSFPCPKGQHLERDRAGFSNCMVQNPYAVAACAACAYTAFSGVGTPTAVGLCLACLSFELNCASKHSKCVCDE